jgi:hypothetical protein
MGAAHLSPTGRRCYGAATSPGKGVIVMAEQSKKDCKPACKPSGRKTVDVQKHKRRKPCTPKK